MPALVKGKELDPNRFFKKEDDMNQDIQKFRELLLTDTEFQQKLQAASEAYTGDQSEEAVFNAVLVPIAAEYGITATFEEFHTYISGLDGAEMSKDELQQVAGGDKYTTSSLTCDGVGIGFGTDENGECIVIGVYD